MNQPRTRQECPYVRPCIHIACRNHMFTAMFRDLDQAAKFVNEHADDDVVDLLFDMPETCVLDCTQRGEHTLEELGAIMGRIEENRFIPVSRERIRQIIGECVKDRNKIRGAMFKVAKRIKKTQFDLPWTKKKEK